MTAWHARILFQRWSNVAAADAVVAAVVVIGDRDSFVYQTGNHACVFACQIQT